MLSPTPKRKKNNNKYHKKTNYYQLYINHNFRIMDTFPMFGYNIAMLNKK